MAVPQRLIAKDEMVTLPAKSLVSILSAIRNLQEHKGSSAKEIIHYISSVHNIPPETVRRKMQTVLKRGVAHGILKEVDGRYSLPIDTDDKCLEIAEQELGLIDFCSRVRQRKLQARKPRRRIRKSNARKHKSSRRTRKARKIKQGKGISGIRRKSKTRKKPTKIIPASKMPRS
ncbi:histone H1, gonadal-like [Belonocnema kinseyi]|uniref:histone H1, gonadal-like n=1 Tax=Belonocnema kinseyi TaxID=2817044 RepID=UPI00143CF60D|nr:histone H1, gonadal-like [Belonocnema kinseyi]